MLKCPELECFVVKDLYFSGGLEFINLNGGLGYFLTKEHDNVLADNLLILTQICKQSKDYYAGVQTLNLGPDLLRLLKSPNKFIKVKVCNLIGQMCKHSSFFYKELKEARVFPQMTRLCADEDKVVKKASSFAIGNAAYYSDTLYDTLAPAVEKIVMLLKDPDERIKTNSIGTISNLTRNSKRLVGEILEYDVPEIFINLLLYDKSLTVKKLVLHAFRNFFKHKAIVNALRAQFTPKQQKRLNKLIDELHGKDLARHIASIKKVLGLK